MSHYMDRTLELGYAKGSVYLFWLAVHRQCDLKFTAPLTGITAAVVGVILNLAIFFG